MADPVIWQAELEVARAAAEEAGRVVMRTFRTQQSVTYKSPDQPQTEADLAADRTLHDALLGAFPQYGWLSEETVDRPDRLARELVWIVDPIDGTRSYLAGKPEFAISIGLALNHEVVLGIVANPATDDLFWATRGGGAYNSRGDKLQVSRTALPATARLVASRSELKAGDFQDFHDDWQYTPLGSTAYKLARVASGEADVFLSRGPKSEWDVCAGDLIVQEAGGRVTDLRGNTLTYNRADPYVHGTLASNGLLHDPVLRAIKNLKTTGRRSEDR
jgi:myo-inositol-1(or 4)-monophosphatase